MRDLEFKVKERCRTEGTRVKLKNQHDSYIYLGVAHGGADEDYSVKRILKHADYKDTTLKIVDNEEYLDNVYLDFSCLENLKALKNELEKDHGFNNNPEKFFKTFSLYKENYSKIKNDKERSAFSDIYREYEEGFKKGILNTITKEFPENKEEVEFISSLTLDFVFQQFIWKIYLDDMKKNKDKK
jgi:hypothetical protein